MKTAAAVLAIGLLIGASAMALTVPEQVKQVVAFIFVAVDGGKLVPNGTGFFVGVKSSQRQDVYHVYLVTAKHVLQRGENGPFFDEIFLRLNRRTGEAKPERYSLVASGDKQTFYVHPDPAVDIAVIPLAPDQATYEFKYLPDQLVTTQEDFTKLGIAEGSDVFFTGLFTPHLGEARNYPVVRFGRVALVTPEKILWRGVKRDLYLIESSSYGGNSGSPVFFFLGPDRRPGSLVLGPPALHLAGVMMGAFQDVRPIQAIQTDATAVSVSNMGIAAVVPAYRLHELLFSEPLKRQRGEHAAPTTPSGSKGDGDAQQGVEADEAR